MSSRECFGDSDSWLLVTLSICRGSVDRKGLKEAGDYVNHAIFLDTEIDEGVARLEASDLGTRVDGDRFEISPAGADLVLQYEKSGKGPVATMIRLGKNMSSTEIGPTALENLRHLL